MAVADKADRSDTSGIDALMPPLFCLTGDIGPVSWGLTPADRLRRGLKRAGCGEEITRDALKSATRAVIILRADAVIDAPLLGLLVNAPGLMLTGGDDSAGMRIAVHAPPRKAETAALWLDGGGSPGKSAPWREAAPHELEAAYSSKLRKREVPYAGIVSTDNRARVEWRMFMATYKGATDFVTKHIWPVPAFYITRLIAPLGVTPNMVTALSAVLVVAAYLWFAQGAWALGIAAAWGMALLDTVDGKLARVTLTSSKFGDVFDHGIDLIHPPFWYYAWGAGLAAHGLEFASATFWWLMAAIIFCYVAQRIMEGIAIKFYGIEIHIWRPIDMAFRQITARRNPNLAILTISAVLGRPDWGLIAVAGWMALCLLLHGVQLAQAHAAFRRDGALTSWLTRPADGS